MGEAGAVPLLVKMLGFDSPEAQDCAVGALANLAVIPRCRELMADAHGIPPLVQLLGLEGPGEGVKEIAVGTLTNLAIHPGNQVMPTRQLKQVDSTLTTETVSKTANRIGREFSLTTF